MIPAASFFCVLSAVAILLAGCAFSPAQPPSPAAVSPAEWQAQLPAAPIAHQGSEALLLQWWRGQGDPLLSDLIAAAQAVSPTLADARAQIANARASRIAAGAALLPTLDASVQANRTSAQPPLPMATTVQGALQAGWEIDLFGGGRAARDAAVARYEGAQAGWHDARVSIAAEVANQYYALRTCERLVEITAADAASRAATGRLTALAAATSRARAARSCRCDSTAAGSAAICSCASCGRLPASACRRRRSSGSGTAVNATRVLMSRSQAARCCTRRLLPSAVVARASAAVAGAWKPASAASAVRRPVAARDSASLAATATSRSQLRKA